MEAEGKQGGTALTGAVEPYTRRGNSRRWASALSNDEPMEFLTLADWTVFVETELFAQTYKSYGLATVRYPVLEIEACDEPFENGCGYSLRALRAGKPRTRS